MQTVELYQGHNLSLRSAFWFCVTGLLLVCFCGSRPCGTAGKTDGWCGVQHPFVGYPQRLGVRGPWLQPASKCCGHVLGFMLSVIWHGVQQPDCLGNVSGSRSLIFVGTDEDKDMSSSFGVWWWWKKISEGKAKSYKSCAVYWWWYLTVL